MKTGATTPAATTAAPAAKRHDHKLTTSLSYYNNLDKHNCCSITGAYLTYGKTQNVIASKTANGVTWYQLENKVGCLPSYVVLNNPNPAASPITDAQLLHSYLLLLQPMQQLQQPTTQHLLLQLQLLDQATQTSTTQQ